MMPQVFDRWFAPIYLILTLAVAPFAIAEEREREGGLTGTGIVGEITELGSIIVNDQRIKFDSQLPVTSALSPQTAEALVPGDTVAALISYDGTDWTALSISQTHTLIGPATAVDAGRFNILGVPVVWPDPPAPGTWVAVSGFWTPDGVKGTRVVTIEPRETVVLQGSYRFDPDASVHFVGTRSFAFEPLQHVTDGDVIRVTGTLEGERIRVTQIKHGLFDQPVGLVLVEGYLSSVAPSGFYTVGGSGLTAYTDNVRAEMPQERLRVCGIDGRLQQQGSVGDIDLLKRLGCPNTSD
jgi:hypothetical protein